MQQKDPLSQSVQYLKAVGPKRAEALKKIGIETVKDLLFYFPSKHLDRSNILDSSKVALHAANGYDGEVTIVGKVESAEAVRYKPRKELFKVFLRDDKGFFECVWFQGSQYIKNYFKPGDYYAISAKPVITKYGSLQFAHPDFDKLGEEESDNFFNTGKIIPFYRIPKELRNIRLGDLSLRKILDHAVTSFSHYIPETLPKEFVAAQGLLQIKEAIRNIHFPENKENLSLAYERFKFEELLFLQLLVAIRKHSFSLIKGPEISVQGNLLSKFINNLPFELTKAQLESIEEIRKDMESGTAMNRLLQGDVGAGKTVVAVASMLLAVESGYQAALAAPTEILADQHYKNITKFLSGLEVNATLLLGGGRKKEKEEKLIKIANGETDIVIGTHALFEENVSFSKLGLVVIDEQHRFGVEQRGKLIVKGKSPHALIMSATPIPRTLSMTVYGDLDASIINSPPKNRLPIITAVRGESSLKKIYEFIVKKNKEENDQAFIIYPLVEESDKIDLKAAQTHYEELGKNELKDLRLGLIHGKMNWKEKEDVMLRFASNEFDALISTTVIEVGIDIPNANIILINDAHRFGLSQLHQLRGRVGRGGRQGYCILATKEDLAPSSPSFKFDFDYLSSEQIEKNKTRIRLNAMAEQTDGFKIAEIDLKLRGPGDIFGSQQSGMPKLKFANIVEDSELLTRCKSIAFEIIKRDPKLIDPSNKEFKTTLLEFYSENLRYASIG